MINLGFDAAYQFPKAEKNQLKRLRSKYGRYYEKGYGKNNKKVWYDGEAKTKAIKHNISVHLMTKSNFCCTYCGKSLARSEKSTDHFIPNAIYPIYSFHPLNLVPSCGYCNETLKNQYDPIATPHRKYHLIDFKMVHPILHDVNTHLYYKAPDNLVIDLARCTNKGKETIRLFELDSLEMSVERAKQQIMAVMYPLTAQDLKQLVAETATYKPKK
jgi:5-methylcytosine-specific restriction endonuclease McrA